jgi:hypothetical protein
MRNDQTCFEIAQASFAVRHGYPDGRVPILIEVKGGGYCSRFGMIIDDGKLRPGTESGQDADTRVQCRQLQSQVRGLPP